jgi:glycosyltransferase involved in cell wall biosynthesis
MSKEHFINTNNFILPKSALNNSPRLDPNTLSIMNQEPRITPTSRGSNSLPEILFITSFPPRECGIATYSHDLKQALDKKFSQSFKISICPLESEQEKHQYKEPTEYLLDTDNANSFKQLAFSINTNKDIALLVIQHEFGFYAKQESTLNQLIQNVSKPVIIAFHTVLPEPDENLKQNVQLLSNHCESVLVMTHASSEILTKDYGINPSKITVIPHGTHLVPHEDKELLKEKHQFKGRKILSTFGLLSSNKNIETTLNALPSIVAQYPEVLFLIIGKTHPSIIKNEGEIYRKKLEDKVLELKLQNHVQFINQFIELPILLEYLQLTDIYLFTSNNPNQAVSGTFSYAISCGCPVISTPIPHAREVLRDDAGIIIDFENSEQLSAAAIQLLENESMRQQIGLKGLHRMASTAWENTAIAHAELFDKISSDGIELIYNFPESNLSHIKKMTTEFGMIQFSTINQADLGSGYTIDDNARAMIAFCQHYELTQEPSDLKYLHIYLNFIHHCQQDSGQFLNYVDKDKKFTRQNYETNISDSNGRAIWALGYLISLRDLLPQTMSASAENIMSKALSKIDKVNSTRSMAFIMKGLYYRNKKNQSTQNTLIMTLFADRLVQMYLHEKDADWEWYESYLTYANSSIPEALLCAWMVTGITQYRDIAKSTFDFLLDKTFKDGRMTVISNKNWMHKQGDESKIQPGGEQPLDVAYTVMALSQFYKAFNEAHYHEKMIDSFNWFLGNNQLHQIVYNPCTGGCYDGLEENYVNLNQGAESTVSYLMAKLCIDRFRREHPQAGGKMMQLLPGFQKQST